jgi:hypothetical protein
MGEVRIHAKFISENLEGPLGRPRHRWNEDKVKR